MSEKVYQGLNFLQNTAFDTYINTLVNLSSELEVEMKYNLLETKDATFTAAFGGRYSVHTSSFIFFSRLGNNQFYLQIGPEEITIPCEHESFNKDYKVIMNKNNTQIYNDDGLLVEKDYSDRNISFSEDSREKVALFAARGDFGYTLCSGIMKLYYCKIKKNGELVRDFVPMKRISDEMYGLFDRVSKTFFVSATGGQTTFTGELNNKYYDVNGENIETTNITRIEYALETKRLIKEKLIEKGVNISDSDTFRSYVKKIDEIQLGTDNYDEYLLITEKILGYYKDYIELEYIENTGGQYIDTGVETSNGYRINSKINVTEWYGSSQACYFSGCLSSGSSYYRDYAVLYASKLMLGMNTDIPSSVECSLNTWYDIDMSTISENGYIKLGNETLLTSQNIVSHNAANIWIFGVNNGNSKFWDAYIKMGATKLYDSTNTLVRDFIPVRMKETNEIGMYDKLNRVFYPNMGTGSFITGPEIQEV